MESHAGSPSVIRNAHSFSGLRRFNVLRSPPTRIHACTDAKLDRVHPSSSLLQLVQPVRIKPSPDAAQTASARTTVVSHLVYRSCRSRRTRASISRPSATCKQLWRADPRMTERAQGEHPLERHYSSGSRGLPCAHGRLNRIYVVPARFGLISRRKSHSVCGQGPVRGQRRRFPYPTHSVQSALAAQGGAPTSTFLSGVRHKCECIFGQTLTQERPRRLS